MLILCRGLLSPKTPKAVIVTVLQFTSLSTLAFVDIPKPLMSSATSFSAVVIQMSMGMGIAVGALALRLAARMHGYETHGYETHGHETTAPALMDFRIAFGLLSILALVAILDCLALDPHAGSEVSGYRRA